MPLLLPPSIVLITQAQNVLTLALENQNMTNMSNIINIEYTSDFLIVLVGIIWEGSDLMASALG